MRSLVTVAKYALALGLLAWLVWSGRLDLAMLASGRGPGFHAVGLLLVTGTLLLQSVRWWQLLAVQGINLSFPKVLRINWIGYFYALLLPGVGGGDVVRGLYIFRDAPDAKLKATSTVLVDRAIGMYAYLCLAGIAVVDAAHWEGAPTVGLESIRLTVVALLAVFSIAAVVLLWRPFRALAKRPLFARRASRFGETLNAYAAQSRLLGLCFLVSLASSMSFLAAFWAAGKVLPVELSATQVLLVVPLVLIVNALPLSPGGLGMGETAAAVLFGACGVANGAILMLTVRLWQALVRAPGLLLQVSRAGKG